MDDLKTMKSLGARNRYLTFEIISESEVQFGDFVNVAWNSILSFLGERGASRAGVWIVKDLWDQKQQKGVVKCSHRAVESVRSALALITRIGDSRIIINIAGVSGTMQSAKTKFFGMRDLASFSQQAQQPPQVTEASAR
ncbi:MAG: Rpp14/Pop5 family protein [Candidatus Aenigmatarchaeota archaeon]